MPRRALTTCSCPGCPELVESGRCASCQRAAEAKRGNFRQRGYGRGHDKRFRPAVLARDVVCVVCRSALATVADHWPLSRRELVERGLDADDPARGRGVCKRCHDQSTAVEQPGGWNASGHGG
jgi:5-methylcytosine-specific restriction protein A